MALYYLDTSAVLKRYIAELGSDWVVRLCSDEEIAVSAITYAELASGLGRRTREGSLSTDRRDDILRTYSSDMRATIVRDATKLLCELPTVIALRALDALQLASARAAVSRATSADVGPVVFVSADQRLLLAARATGFDVDNPHAHP